MPAHLRWGLTLGSPILDLEAPDLVDGPVRWIVELVGNLIGRDVGIDGDLIALAAYLFDETIQASDDSVSYDNRGDQYTEEQPRGDQRQNGQSALGVELCLGEADGVQSLDHSTPAFVSAGRLAAAVSLTIAPSRSSMTRSASPAICWLWVTITTVVPS